MNKEPSPKELSRRELQRAAAKKILELPVGKPITFEDLIPNGVCAVCSKPVMALGLTGIKLWTCECRNVAQLYASTRKCPWCGVPLLRITNVANSGQNRDPEIEACDCSDKRLLETMERLAATLARVDMRMDEIVWTATVNEAKSQLQALMNDMHTRRRNRG